MDAREIEKWQSDVRILIESGIVNLDAGWQFCTVEQAKELLELALFGLQMRNQGWVPAGQLEFKLKD